MSTKSRRQRDRGWLIKHFGLNEFTSNTAICQMISNALEWEMPGARNQIGDYLKKARFVLQNQNKPDRRKSDKSFYSSGAWRSLRYSAFKKYGAKCCLCGAKPEDGVVLHVDHIKPRSRYPHLELDLDNLQILCEDCNFGKSNVDETDWRHWKSL